MITRTVLADLQPNDLGRVNYHEHLFHVSGLLPGDELDDETRSGREAELLRASGFEAMVDATPYGLGRQPAAVARISATQNLHVIAATGVHREAHYPGGHWLRELKTPALTALFTTDITEGMPATEASFAEARGPRADGRVRAGLIKTGIGYWSISTFERTVLEAAAATHKATGAPIMVHLEFCTAAHELLDLLGGLGVPAHRVVLAHADRDPNPALHCELASRGAYLGYDGVARPLVRSEAELIDLTARVVEAGHDDRILLGADVARRTRFIAYGGMPGMEYLGRRYLPQLQARIGEAALASILVANPAAAFSFTPAG